MLYKFEEEYQAILGQAVEISVKLLPFCLEMRLLKKDPEARKPL